MITIVRTPGITRFATGLIAGMLAAHATSAAAQPVRQVIDGDTMTVAGVGVVRLIGVDAPEKTGGYRESEPFGDAATTCLRALVNGQTVALEFDGPRKDKFNRTLAYVVLPDGRYANEEVIRAGCAETYRRFEFKRKAQFQAAEREAQAAKRGMWATRPVRSKRPRPPRPRRRRQRTVAEREAAVL